MRITLRQYSQDGVRALHTAAMAAVTALMLTACQDQPTSPGVADDGSDGIIEFELTPEGAAAARGAAMVGTHKLPTVPLRQAAMSGTSALLGSVDNSPFDLTYYGGKVVTAATSYNVYVNCLFPETAATCWGTGTLTPGTFVRDLNRSSFIKLLNEYIKEDATLNFPVREMKTRATFADPTRATLQEIQHIVADAVLRSGVSGYGAIYHVFLPKGTGMCIVPGNCYSPDDEASWAFCAFHGSVNLAGGQHVLFTLEPYQAVEGCQLPGQTPNGVIDATASTLSHELFETITDPDLDGWSNDLFGYEMSDMCTAFGSNQLLNGHQYFLQSEYSNTKHLCTSQAPGV